MIGAVIIMIILVIVLYSVFNSKNFNAGNDGSYIMRSNIKKLRKDQKNDKKFFMDEEEGEK